MRKFIVEHEEKTATRGYYVVVEEGETGKNRFMIKTERQFYTTEEGYDYCHPQNRALVYAQSIADGLNQMEARNQGIKLQPTPGAMSMAEQFLMHTKLIKAKLAFDYAIRIAKIIFNSMPAGDLRDQVSDKIQDAIQIRKSID